MGHDLIAWMQFEFSSPEAFIERLGLDGHNREMSTTDLAARLMALGFEGDALGIASRVARDDGGVFVTVDSLYSVLKGGPRRAFSTMAYQPGYLEMRERGQQDSKSPDFGFGSKLKGAPPPAFE